MREELLEQQASHLRRDGDYFAALITRQELQRLYEANDGDARDQARNLHWIAYLAVQVDEQLTAEEAARKSVAIYEAACPDRDASLATYLMVLACVLAERQLFEEAQAFGEKGLDILTEIHAPEDEYVGVRRKLVARMARKEPGVYLERYS